jgi:hypothetical protein
MMMILIKLQKRKQMPDYTPVFILYVYLSKALIMTVKLNLTIDEKIVAKSKRYAAKKKTTVSKMVQDFLKKQIELDERKPKKTSFVEKWAGTFSGQLSDARIKEIKDEYVSKKYGV